MKRRVRSAFATTALAVGLSVAVVPTSAQAEPVGVPVPPSRGGVVTAWGAADHGKTTVPAVLDDEAVTAVAAGRHHALALTSDGEVVAWGSNSHGQSVPPAELTDETVTGIAARRNHSLAVTSDGEVAAWGDNLHGQSTVPDSLDGKRVTAVAASEDDSLALTSDGKLTSWGWGFYGQATIPTALDGSTVTAIAAGGQHFLALTSDGRVVGWGQDDDGQATAPASLDGRVVTAIAAGNRYSVALTSDGRVTVWGDESGGHTTVPPELATKTVVAIASSDGHILALTDDGKVTGWGWNVDGEATSPPSLGGQVVTGIAAGSSFSLAIGIDFRAESSPAISGDPVAGGTLTATPGRYTATPHALAYQWYADGAPLAGATAATYRPTAAEVGRRLTVRVTATLAGHAPVVTSSDPVGPVRSAGAAPTVRIEAAKTTVRRGQAVSLSWSSTGATTVTASGGWSGAKPAAGTAQVAPTALGSTTYVLTATNAAGTTTAQVDVRVTRPAARLRVKLTRGKHRAGSKVKVTVRGLEAGETYTIRVGRKKVVGKARSTRPVVRAVRLPARPGRATVRVTGDQPDRTGAARVRVVRQPRN